MYINFKMPFYGIPYYNSFDLSTVCIEMLIQGKIVNSDVLCNEKYDGSSNVLYADYVHSGDGIKCGMKKCRIVYCFCRAYKIMYSASFSDTQWLQAITSYGGLDVTFL